MTQTALVTLRDEDDDSVGLVQFMRMRVDLPSYYLDIDTLYTKQWPVEHVSVVVASPGGFVPRVEYLDCRSVTGDVQENQRLPFTVVRNVTLVAADVVFHQETP